MASNSQVWSLGFGLSGETAKSQCAVARLPEVLDGDLIVERDVVANADHLHGKALTRKGVSPFEELGSLAD